MPVDLSLTAFLTSLSTLLSLVFVADFIVRRKIGKDLIGTPQVAYILICAGIATSVFSIASYVGEGHELALSLIGHVPLVPPVLYQILARGHIDEKTLEGERRKSSFGMGDWKKGLELLLVGIALLFCLRVVIPLFFGRDISVWFDASLISLSLIVAVPITEELFFRFLLQTIMEQNAGPGAGLLISSSLAAVMHIPVIILGSPTLVPSFVSMLFDSLLPSLIPILIWQFLLGWTYQRTGSIYYPILLHAMYNGSAIFVKF